MNEEYTFTCGGMTSSCGTLVERNNRGAIAHNDESNRTDNEP